MNTIETDLAPKAIGPYSQGVVANGFLYTSGQIPLNPQTNAIEASGIEEQAEQTIKNIGEILKAAGSDFSKVVKTTTGTNTIYTFCVIFDDWLTQIVGNRSIAATVLFWTQACDQANSVQRKHAIVCF